MAAGQNIVGEVGLRVVPVDPAAQFQAGVDQIIKRLEKNAQFQVKAAGLDQVTEQANNAGRAFADAAVQAAGMTAAIYGIKASVEGAINKLSALFDQLAQAKAGFTSILHSEAAGGKLLNDIREFARVSPFVTQELVNYSQQLLGVGLSAEKIIPLLKSTGDIISSVGGDTQNLGRVLFTLTQIKSIGSLKGQDTLQLQNSLIPITKYLSEYLHKSTAEIVKLRENSLITSEDVFNALNAQGEKVKGAMDRATRNIAGAKAILSDTITQLFQNQPVLNKIFTDVYKSIQTLANRIGEEDFQQAFTQFFDGIDKVYTGLKPLLAELGKLSGSGALTGMKVLGSTFSAIGEALSSIPKPAIEAFARLLVALGTLKAPLLLLKYATSIKTMYSAIIPTTSSLAKMALQQEKTAVAATEATAAVNAETAAFERNAAAAEVAGAAQGAAVAKSQGFLARNAGKIGGAAIIGGQLAGQYFQGRPDAASQTAGGALSGASTGALFGSALGPEGAVAGAVIGGLYGGISSYFGRQDAEIKKHIEAMKKAGTENAQAFISAEDKKFNGKATGAEFTDYNSQIATVTGKLKVLTDERQKIVDKLESLGFKDIKLDESPEIAGITTQLETLKSQAAATFDGMRNGLEQLVLSLDKTEKGFFDLTQSAGSGQNKGRAGGGRGNKGAQIPLQDLAEVEVNLKKYGLTLADLAPEAIEVTKQVIQAFDGITDAQLKATQAAQKYNDTLAAGLKAADTIFGPQEKTITERVSNMKTIDDALKAQYTTGSLSADLAAKEAQYNAAKVKYAQAYTTAIIAGKTAQEAALAGNVAADNEFKSLQVIHDSARNNDAIAARRNRANLEDPATRDASAQGRDINGEIKKAEDDKKKFQDEVDKQAKKAAEDALAYADKVKSATTALADKLQSAADAIATAAERWVGSIKERTQYEKAISAGTAIKNTERQIADLTELTAGLNELRARGLTDDAIKSLGIDNVNDVKQVRKLLKANPGDLSKLSGDVSTLNSKATDLATAAENKRTQDNIRDGIIAAANTLGIDLSKPSAAAIASTFNITTTTDADAVANAILFALSGGKVGR